VELGRAFIDKAREFESAALESAMVTEVERADVQERFRQQQQDLQDTVKVQKRVWRGQRMWERCM
jgi:hypothetical protein